jgi:hypothetical protein
MMVAYPSRHRVRRTIAAEGMDRHGWGHARPSPTSYTLTEQRTLNRGTAVRPGSLSDPLQMGCRMLLYGPLQAEPVFQLLLKRLSRE